MRDRIEDNRERNDSREAPELDLSEIAHVLKEYKWIIAAVTAVVLGAGVLWTLGTPKIYQATSTLEYDPNPSRPLGGQVEDVADPIGNFWATREFFGTQNMVIASRDVAGRAVRRLGLHEDPTYVSQDEDSNEPAGDVEVATLALQSRLTIDPVPDTRLVRIHVRDINPERARLIVDAVAEAYVEKTIEDRLESTDRAKDWLERQLATLAEELDEAELALHDFKKSHNVLSVSMEDRQNLVASDIQATNDKLTETRNRRIELEARWKRLKASLGEGASQDDPGALTDDPALSELMAELRDKKQERDALGVKYGREHPSMKTLDGEIGVLERQVAQEKAAIITSAQRDVMQIKAVEEGLRAAAGSAQTAGLNLNLREIEYRLLNRERDNKAKLYEIVLERLTETDLTRMLKTTHVRVLDRALLPTAPVSPNLAKNTGASLLAGLLLGLLAAFVGSRLDRTIRSVESVEALGIDVLGVIPHLAAFGPSESAARDRKGDSVPQQGDPLIALDAPMSPAAETFRMIRTNLAFKSEDDPLRCAVITSAMPLEGKTTIASNLAVTLAQFGRSVLLVDSDLRRPRLHRVLGVRNETGLSTLVAGQSSRSESIRPTKVEGLSILTSGPIPHNPSELLHSDAFGRLKDELLSHYDYVLFDSPPMGAVTDAAILAPQVDGVILVVRAGTSTIHAVDGAKKRLLGVSGRILGAILNDADLRIKGYRYGAGAYAYADGYHPIEEGADAA